MDARDRWLLASNFCWDCCKVSHVCEAVPGHVDGQVVGDEEICSEDEFSDVSYVELLG